MTSRGYQAPQLQSLTDLSNADTYRPFDRPGRGNLLELPTSIVYNPRRDPLVQGQSKSKPEFWEEPLPISAHDASFHDYPDLDCQETDLGPNISPKRVIHISSASRPIPGKLSRRSSPRDRKQPSPSKLSIPQDPSFGSVQQLLDWSSSSPKQATIPGGNPPINHVQQLLDQVPSPPKKAILPSYTKKLGLPHPRPIIWTHNPLSSSNERNQPTKVNQESQTRVLQQEHLIRVQRDSVGRVPCDVPGCAKSYKSLVEVFAHKQAKHPEQPISRCKDCNRRFRDPIELRLHEISGCRLRYQW